VLVATAARLAPTLLRRPTPWAVVAGGWVAVGILTTTIGGWWSADRTATRVVVAAMGHGCGIVVRSPAGKCLVYDAGRLGAPGAARRAMAAVLWSENVSRIDSLVISHADTDHFNAVPELLERFAVGELVVTRAFLASPSPAVADVVERVRRRGIQVRTVAAGDAFALDRACRARVLHPAADAPPGHGDREADNETSIVLAIESAGRRVLLTGDLEGRALAGFVAAGPDSCDVLVAPHHGTRTSLPPHIARVTSPQLVLVSGVGGSGWPDVRDAYRDASEGPHATVLKTGGEGAIRVAFDAEVVDVERFAAGRWRWAANDGDGKASTGVTPYAREVAAARGPRR
jgi:competence protein ComEC